jgi:hypothetical protein
MTRGFSISAGGSCSAPESREVYIDKPLPPTPLRLSPPRLSSDQLPSVEQHRTGLPTIPEDDEGEEESERNSREGSNGLVLDTSGTFGTIPCIYIVGS